MEYGLSDSSGTDDDLPVSHQNRSARGGHVTRNGRPIIGGFPYPRVQDDMESQIHHLELEAYCSVLRAFKAQSDAITWEKESFITELRKELRMSDDEHRESLSRVNADEIICQIREWRQSGSLQIGFFDNAQTNLDIESNVSASRKRQKTSHSVRHLSLVLPPPGLHSQAIGVPMQASSSVARRGAPGVRGKRPKLYAPTGLSERGQSTNRSNFSAMQITYPDDFVQYDPLIGRKVMTRWPDDNNFYEAVIRDYDVIKGLHLLSYDMNTPNETWEWVNLQEISPEDIRWEGEEPGITHGGAQGGPCRGAKKSGRGGGTKALGRGRGFLKNETRGEFPPTQNGIKMKNPAEIVILNTNTLIKEVEKIISVAHPDLLEIEKAKKILKEHEQSLLDAIARLAYASDGESEDGEHNVSHGHSMDQDRSWRNQQFTRNEDGSNCDDGMVREGREVEVPNGEHTIGGADASDFRHDGDVNNT